jgi:hypothetical protein
MHVATVDTQTKIKRNNCNHRADQLSMMVEKQFVAKSAVQLIGEAGARDCERERERGRAGQDDGAGRRRRHRRVSSE